MLPDQNQTQPARRIVLRALASDLHLPCLSMTLLQSPSTVGNTPLRTGGHGSAPYIYPSPASDVSTTPAPTACAIIDTAASVVRLIIRACSLSFGVLRRKVQEQHLAPTVTVTQLAHVSFSARSLAALPAWRGPNPVCSNSSQSPKVDGFL